MFRRKAEDFGCNHHFATLASLLNAFLLVSRVMVGMLENSSQETDNLKNSLQETGSLRSALQEIERLRNSMQEAEILRNDLPETEGYKYMMIFE